MEARVDEYRLARVAAMGLVIGAALGLVGSFVPSSSLRGLAWGLDGTTLVVATALLTIHHLRRGNDLVAGGFLVFAVGQGLVVSGAAMELSASAPSFGAGAGLWAASLAIVSASRMMPLWVRGTGSIAAILLTVVALMIFAGNELTPLSQPLPFFAYPFLVATLLGWAWVHYRLPGRT
jgi:hypothetical protein